MDRRATTGGGIAAVAGVVLLATGTWLHPMQADPNDAIDAFTEYAADRVWVASHLMQLAGVLLMSGALLVLERVLAEGRGAWWARIGAAGATAGIALAAALQAVDGIALKRMVDAWAGASEPSVFPLFAAAFAVRQIEVGLAAMLSIVLGSTTAIYGVAMHADSRFAPWIGWLAVFGGFTTACAGVVMAYTGFSDATMMINMPANFVLLLWMLAVGRILLGLEPADPA
ncbi:MAG TPA: hypothetical protein VN634_10070 [Candidatus Limnocylindrales bacterium]|nr:hypothetical protein [Candidatus Limnocylindrales bacterium]